MIKREKIRISKIVKTDALAVLELSNQKSVRSVSFNQNKIKLADHTSWFAGKLLDKNVIYLKASVNGTLAGQVRLDIAKKTAVIGVSTSERYRGRGIATRLIKRIVQIAQNRGLLRIDGYIKPENRASQAFFEKIGWIYQGRKKISGNLALKYSLKLKVKK